MEIELNLGFAWLCLALLGFALLCFALLGFAWLCLALLNLKKKKKLFLAPIILKLEVSAASDLSNF
jgi:hypothetical protein